MNHLLEILKIVEGAFTFDRQKIAAYCEQLARKLEEEGDTKAAKKIQALLTAKTGGELAPAYFRANSPLPVDSDSRLRLGEEQVLEEGSVQVCLERSAEEKIERFIAYIQKSDQFIRRGVEISPTLLLYGPPGCGKTLIAKSIATKLRLPLITARIDSIVSSYLGSTSKNLRSLFDHAKERPCVLFLDEFDAIAKLRDDSHELGELKRVVVSLLQNIDTLDRKTILIAATNHEHLLDSAIWRRFAYRIQIGLPGYQIREALFSLFLADLLGEKARMELASVSEGMTGAEIQHTAEEALRQAILTSQENQIENLTLRCLVNEKIPDATSSEDLASTLEAVRSLSPEVFTYRRLAEIFDCSLGKVSRLLSRKEGAHHA